MKKYDVIEIKVLFLDVSDVITKSDSDFGADANDNDLSNASGSWQSFVGN